MHPEVQDRLYEEIKTFWTDPLDYDSLQNFTYLNMVVNESLRLLPILPYLLRRTTADVKLGILTTNLFSIHFKLNLKFISENFTIPAGVNIVINLFHLLRNADAWGKDFKSFNPDNFLPENIERIGSANFLPFSYGPRNCIGYKYAMVSVKIALITVLKNFKLKTTHTMDNLRFDLDLMIKLKEKHMVTLEIR